VWLPARPYIICMSACLHVCMSACLRVSFVSRTLGFVLSACIVDSRTNVIERDVGVDMPE
jgi:hypothetical protein